MNIQIGNAFRSSRSRASIGIVVATGTVAIDFVMVLGGAWTDANRTLLALLSLSMLLVITHDRGRSLGFVLRLRPNFLYWVKATAIIGVVIGAFAVVVSVVIWILNVPVEWPKLPPKYVSSRLIHMCVVAPLLEETLYRVVLCAPLAAVVGARWTIFLASVIFAGLHFAYGNPGPDNFIAGFFLAWAYLKSGSAVLPIALHSLGNGVVAAFQVFNWWICK
jgi:membrane protease YdiL (CAAX protease family)